MLARTVLEAGIPKLGPVLAIFPGLRAFRGAFVPREAQRVPSGRKLLSGPLVGGFRARQAERESFRGWGNPTIGLSKTENQPPSSMAVLSNQAYVLFRGSFSVFQSILTAYYFLI